MLESKDHPPEIAGREATAPSHPDSSFLLLFFFLIKKKSEKKLLAEHISFCVLKLGALRHLLVCCQNGQATGQGLPTSALGGGRVVDGWG